MATGLQNQEWVPENFRKQLALAVRSIQWSYGIFWSISTTQPGVLKWCDGYYNGDIKTRKTIQSVEPNPDQMGLQRSEQLRELYESLATSESNPQAKRPAAALSPEDLTDTEWYYLVCMSFTFNIGQGLPGRTYGLGQPIWVCHAHIADSKVFTRSLLAKSASIQTVVCFPFLGGVIELGVTDKVSKNLSLIQHIQTAFLERPYPVLSNNFISSAGNTQYNKQVCSKFDDEILDTKLKPLIECGELILGSPNNSSNGIYPDQVADDCFMVDGMNEGASQVQNWQYMDEEFSNCVHNSMNSSDCISQTFVEPEKVIPIVRGDKLNNHCLLDLQECNDLKLNSLDLRTDDLHYQSVLTSLLKTSDQLVLGPHYGNCNKVSSFNSWKKEGLASTLKPSCGRSQKLLKKVLFEVAKMHGGRLLKTQEDNGRKDGVWRPEVEEIEIDVNHAVSERRRREKLNERFSILRSLIPSKNKVDKVSVLDDTIEYLKELERRVEELETCKESSEVEATITKKHQDNVERTSDNYGNDKIGNGKKPLLNKRKACDIDETDSETTRVSTKDTYGDNITVSMTEKDVLIELRCPWRECLLLEMMDAVSNLHLDSHSVQSSTIDGILFVTINSKFKGSPMVSAAKIRQALQRIFQKS